MVIQLLIGLMAIAATVLIHATFMMTALGPALRFSAASAGSLRRAGTIVAVVLWFFFAICLQCWFWCILLLKLGAFDSMEESLYFATVSFTSLGYGDIVLGEDLRLLGAFCAANGALIIGWTTALIYLAVERTYGLRDK
jgi:hypothetical protein